MSVTEYNIALCADVHGVVKVFCPPRVFKIDPVDLVYINDLASQKGLESGARRELADVVKVSLRAYRSGNIFGNILRVHLGEGYIESVLNDILTAVNNVVEHVLSLLLNGQRIIRPCCGAGEYLELILVIIHYGQRLVCLCGLCHGSGRAAGYGCAVSASVILAARRKRRETKHGKRKAQKPFECF